VTTTKNHLARIGAAVAILVAISALAGCGNSSSGGSKSANSGSATSTASVNSTDASTARKAAQRALSTLSTAAPDGVVLYIRTPTAVPATVTPAWEVLVGSPKTNNVYSVLILEGIARFHEAGQVSFSPAQWEQVPGLSAWKLDSDVARQKALSVYPKGLKQKYVTGMLAYIPVSGSDTTARPLRWSVTFDPSEVGSAATSTVYVDVDSGTATLAK
jgi:hypothetical protein